MFYHLLYPRQIVLISSSHAGKQNLATLAWTMPVSMDPPLLAISLSTKRFSYSLIEKSREFVLATTHERMKDAILVCGTRSGKDCDKFRESGLTSKKASKVGAPLVAEAVTNLECKVVGIFPAGDHALIVGEVVAAHEPQGEKKKLRLLYDSGGRNFFGLEQGNK